MKTDKKEIIRSPFFYVGDKYKLMSQLQDLFPDNIDTYIEPFVGGGSPFLNTKANNYKVNDIDYYVIQLHKELYSYKDDFESLLRDLFKIIDKYQLSCSFRGIFVPDELKIKYKKTYYSKYNKDSYINLRKDFNNNKDNILKLYILIIYGFNRMIRFNLSGDFNVPSGNVDFNKNVFDALYSYINFVSRKNIEYYNKDYKDFIGKLDIKSNDFIFLDPPYLISMSEYNKIWNKDKERELCSFLDKLDSRNIKWGITNLLTHKGKENLLFKEWANKYNVYSIESNYISFNDNTIKENSKEVYVTNHEKKKDSTEKIYTQTTFL